MAATYAGVDITPLTESLSVICERWWVREAPDLWQWPGYALDGIQHLPIPDRPKPERARLNTLVWPSGASRWAVFHTLVGGAQATAIKDAVGTAPPGSGTLLLTDSIQGTQVSATMYVVALRPVFVSAAENLQLYWLTLVDRRYFWWTQYLTYTFSSGDTWEDLLIALVEATGAGTPTVSTVHADYLTPDPARWTRPGRPLPLLIDAAAATVGKRFLSQMNGALEYVGFTDSAPIDLAQFQVCEEHLVMGSRLTVPNLIGNIPANAITAFWGDVTTTVTLPLSGLGLSEYGGLNGRADTYAWIVADLHANSSNTQRTNYATQAATDYYGWQLTLTDATFRGIQALIPTGFEDRVEWEYMPGIRSFPAAPRGPQKQMDGFPEFGMVPGRNVSELIDKELPWNRWTTRIVPRDWGDRNLYGDRPPPGYTYRVQLTATDGTAWKANIRSVSSIPGGSVTTGPQLGWGADLFVLYTDGTANVGDYGVAVPDPFLPNTWIFSSSMASQDPVGYRTDCYEGIQIRYISYDGGQTWYYDSLQGCCECTGSTGGPPPITTLDCCESVPFTIYLVWEEGCASFECATAIELHYIGYAEERVDGPPTNGYAWHGGGTCNGHRISVYLSCDADGNWQFSFNSGLDTYFGEAFVVSCDPFCLTITLPIDDTDSPCYGEDAAGVYTISDTDAGCGGDEPCCDPAPAGNLTATVSDESGDCTCLPATLTFIRDTATRWHCDLAADLCTDSPAGTLQLLCLGGAYVFNATAALQLGGVVSSAACDPDFLVVVDVTALGGLCSGGFRLTFAEA